MRKKTLSVYVATHKQVRKYTNDDCYKLLQVGTANHVERFGYMCDNTGENISDKNATYCELTGLYWIWKNAVQDDYVGFCHYRRYFARHAYSRKPEKEILSSVEILKYMEENDILLPQKIRKNKNNAYCPTERELIGCRPFQYISLAMKDRCPDYIGTLREIFMAKEMCFGNIFVLPWNEFTKYCQWLFDLLDDIEQEIIRKQDETPREYGYLSEWLLNVWVKHNNLKAFYVPIIFTEEQYNGKYLIKMAKERITGVM